MTPLILPCTECGHPLVARSVDALTDAIKEHKQYHRWLYHQAKKDALAGKSADQPQ